MRPPRIARPRAGLRPLVPALALALTAGVAAAQTSFSIDYRNPTIGLPDCAGVPITEGDILVPVPGLPAPGPLPVPCILISGGPAGLGLPLHPGCVGHPPGLPCGVELDALSFGFDGPAFPGMPPGSFWFSVDEAAAGIGGTPAPPAVWTETLPVGEAAADAFVDLGLPPGPLPPFAAPPGNTGAVDGDGLAGPSPFAYPGLGLIEPIGPVCGVPTTGDNVDAFDAEGPAGGFVAVFFSLDAAFADPLCGIPYSGSGPANTFAPGAVLAVFGAGGPPVVYAPPGALGLDLFGPGTDDLDALALFENGAAGYQVSPGPYAGWGGPSDMLIFSVRRGSAVIGAPDSIFGLPIEPGDLLIPPVAGGVSPFPGIFIAAENLGLTTTRSMGVIFGDELDALDVLRRPLFDCNGNGVEDAVDIAFGTPDCNSNGIPDGCECPVTVYCTAKVNSQGCTPAISGAGLPSASCVTPFLINATNVLNNKSGLLFYGFGPLAAPFQCGTLCVSAPIKRTTLQSSGGNPPPNDCSGNYSYDFNARIQSGIDPALTVGATVYAQYWSRDPGFPAPCNTGLTDGLSFSICP